MPGRVADVGTRVYYQVPRHPERGPGRRAGVSASTQAMHATELTEPTESTIHPLICRFCQFCHRSTCIAGNHSPTRIPATEATKATKAANRSLWSLWSRVPAAIGRRSLSARQCRPEPRADPEFRRSMRRKLTPATRPRPSRRRGLRPSVRRWRSRPCRRVPPRTLARRGVRRARRPTGEARALRRRGGSAPLRRR